MTGRASPSSPAPNPSTAQARVLLDELARCGVRHVVACPGSRSTALVVAAHAHPDLLLHVALDERSAGYVALGIGRASGQPAAVVVTSGTAVANLLPAVVEADHDRVPLLLLTADRPPELHGVGANQTIEQVGIFGSSTRWTLDLGVATGERGEVARWRWTAARAHGTAVGRPVEVPAVVSLDAWQAPGPVHLDLPFREPTVPVSDDGRTSAPPYDAPLDGRPDGVPWATSEVEPHVPSGARVERVLAQLVAEPRGLVVVGGGGVADVGPVARLATGLGWPVIVEPHARVERPGGAHVTDPVLRYGSLLLGDAAFAAANEPRTVLRIGRATVSREVATLLDRVPSTVVDAHGGWTDKDDERTDLLRGAAAPTVAALAARLDDRRGGVPDTTWLDTWVAADGRVAVVVEAHVAAADLDEPTVARTVVDAVPPGGRLVVGSSMPIRDVDLVGRAGGAGGAAGPAGDGRTAGGGEATATPPVLANRGASGIDGVVSTALGVAVVDGAATVALVGDLTLLHDSTAWLLREDAAGAPADLVVVVVDNDGGGIFSFLPQRTHVEGFERLFGTPHGLDLGDLATLHGLGYAAPTTIDELAHEVRTRAAAGGRHLVHVRTDRDENLAVHAALRSAVRDALALSG